MGELEEVVVEEEVAEAGAADAEPETVDAEPEAADAEPETAEGSAAKELKNVEGSGAKEDTGKESVVKGMALKVVATTVNELSGKKESEASEMSEKGTCRSSKALYTSVAAAVVYVVLGLKMMADLVMVIGSAP